MNDRNADYDVLGFIYEYLSGNPYLESHHIIWLSEGGADVLENTAALCPNCHKKMHIVNNAELIKELNDLGSSF